MDRPAVQVSPDVPLVERMRGGRGLKRDRPFVKHVIERSASVMDRLNAHDRDRPRVGRPPGRPPLYSEEQVDEYERLSEFRVHSWGESAVGAIGQHIAEKNEWETNFERLVEHFNITRASLPANFMDTPLQKRKGTTPPPKGTPLRAWVDTQRQLYRHGELDVKRQQRLQDTGLQLTLKGKLREVDWETMVGRLKSFYMLHGHCRVHEQEGEELLEQWVQVQQMKEMRGTLSHEKQALLNSLGMSWSSSWLESWKQLCLLKQHHGRVRAVILKSSKRTLPLYIWLRNQKLMEMEGSLDKERVDWLARLGCRWGGPGTENPDAGSFLGSSILDRYLVWEPRFNYLILFKQMQGHCDIPSFLVQQNANGGGNTALHAPPHQHTPSHLHSASGNWTLKDDVKDDVGHVVPGSSCSAQLNLNDAVERAAVRGGPGRPPKKQRELLLRNFRDLHGASANKDGSAIGKFQTDLPLVALWLQEQRIQFERNKLESGHKERLVALEALSPDATPLPASPRNLQTEWLQRLDELRRFKRVTGHCSVPMKYPSNPGLARWVHTQRMRRRNGKMSAGRARQLEKLGFIFEGRSQWEQRFLELVRFKDRVGHCSPCQIGPNRRLGVWVAVQRVKYRKEARAVDADERERERERALGQSALDERALDADADARGLDPLSRHSPALSPHAHSNPYHFFASPQVSGIYLLRQQGQLKESRIKKLESIGFSWELHMDWDSRMQQLRVFKAKYGHCNVPQQIKMNGKGRVGTCSLGTWVTMQRMKRRSGRLSERQMQQLDTIGFSWGLHAEWESRYQELLTFEREHGHCNVPQKYSNNPSLGAWVAQQRRRYKHGTLSGKRILLMEQAGVEWSLRRGRHAHAQWSSPQVAGMSNAVSQVSSPVRRAARTTPLGSQHPKPPRPSPAAQEGSVLGASEHRSTQDHLERPPSMPMTPS